ncbi:hypothetical protein J1L44_001833 [Salmonella enterica subsp. enterica serovar Panama]|nr:hypothetical protein [Salmonella enterica subsp. enterica serovar Panama]
MSCSDTPEQAAVIAWQGNRLVVGAFAGTGKTTTLSSRAKICEGCHSKVIG